jgi:hypothetical protein
VSLAEFIDSNRLYSLSYLGYLKPMIRTDVVRRLNARYDEHLRIGEDYNFLARIMAHGHQIRLEPSAMYFYRKHATSISHRMSAADIHALLDADQRFYRQDGADAPETLAGIAVDLRRCYCCDQGRQSRTRSDYGSLGTTDLAAVDATGWIAPETPWSNANPRDSSADKSSERPGSGKTHQRLISTLAAKRPLAALADVDETSVELGSSAKSTEWRFGDLPGKRQRRANALRGRSKVR